MVAIAVGLAALASFARPRLGLVLVLTAITALLVTAAIGVFHVGVEYHWWEGPQACTGNVPRGLSPEELKKYLFGAKMVRCDQAAWEMWGISMAGWNAIVSAGLAFVRASRVARRGTSRMGDKAEMGCRVGIEETIEEDYAGQAAWVGDEEAALRGAIEKFRAEEIEHGDPALAAGAEQARAYEALTAAIKAGSRLAIWLSTRI